jgi:hypothetical protein
LVLVILNRWFRPMDVHTERQAARAAGIPLTSADFPLPHYSPAQDSSPKWKALAPMLGKLDRDPTWRAIEAAEVDGTPPKSSNPDLFRLISEERETLNGIHAAAAKAGRSPSRDFGPAVLYPDLPRLRDAAKLLRLESLATARRGNPEEAIRNQALGFRLAKQAAEEPNIIGFLVGNAVERLTLSGMGDILRESPTPAVSAAVRAALVQGAPRYDFVRALKGEALTGLATIRMGDPPAFVRAVYQDPSEAVYLHFVTKQIRAAALPPNRRAEAMRAAGRGMDFTPLKGPSYLLTSTLHPVYSRAGDREVQVMARRAVLLAGADALAYRSQHGAFPTRLDIASPNAVDPFTEKALGYRRTAKGFVVYSSGPDGAFNGLPGRAAAGQAYFSYPDSSLTPATRRTAVPPLRPMPAGNIPKPARMPSGPSVPVRP